MKKHIMAALVAILVVLGIGTIVSQASATEGKPSSENKKVTLCHATGSDTNPYTKITVSVNAFYNAGHIDHTGDIWEAFSYTTKKGDVVNVPARGDTGLLAFDDCKAPKIDEPIAQPEPVFLDPCGTENDVFSVAPGRGYTVHGPAMEGDNQVITVKLEDGFKWNVGGDNYNDLRFVKPAFTDVDCDLPDTGVGAEYATAAGWVALGGVVLLLGMTLISKRRDRRSNS